MAASRRIFAKLDPGFYNNPKVIRAGRDGREVYQLVLCLNAAQGALGYVNEESIEPWYLATQLRITEEEAAAGVRAAVAARLIEIAEGWVRIVGWDEDWSRLPKTTAERMREYRGRQRNSVAGTTSNDSAHVGETVTNRDDENVTRYAKNTALPIRGEERRRERDERNSLSVLLPSDWQPTPEHVQLALSLGLDLTHELSAFRAHSRSTGQRFVDWNARFEKWLRGSRDKGKGPKRKPGSTAPPRPKTYVDPVTGEAYVEPADPPKPQPDSDPSARSQSR